MPNVIEKPNNTHSTPGTGVVDTSGGTLRLSGGGTSNGSFTGTGTGTLEFGGGTHSLTAASSINAANVTFSGGTTTMAGSYSATGTTGSSNTNSSLSSVLVNYQT